VYIAARKKSEKTYDPQAGQLYAGAEQVGPAGLSIDQAGEYINDSWGRGWELTWEL
jgi:hypothetical protein